MASTGEVTRLLVEIRHGNEGARSQLWPLVYDELRRLARAQFRRERGEHTLQPTALVHEAFIRLIGQREPLESHGHFLALAATQMRRILVDYARKYRRRAGGGERVLLEDSVALCGPRPLDILALDEALRRLASLDLEQARLVELRFFGGLSIEETAEAMSVSTATVERSWRSARAFLRRNMEGTAIAGRAVDNDPEEI